MKHALMDGPTALGFVLSQRTHLETEVMQKPYPNIKFQSLVPVDTTAREFAQSVTFFTRDTVGKAKFINATGDDIPFANTTMSKFEMAVNTAAIGSQWSYEAIGAAREMGINLETDQLDAARQAYLRLVDDVAFTGDTTLGVEGLFNTTGITSIAAGATFAASSSAQIVQIIVNALAAIRTATLETEFADTIILPIAQHALIATRAYGVEGGLTVEDYIRKAALSLNGVPVTIVSDYRLSNTMVIYKRDPSVLKMHMPMPLRFMPPEAFNFKVKILGMFRFSPLNIRKPQAIRYVTGI